MSLARRRRSRSGSSARRRTATRRPRRCSREAVEGFALYDLRALEHWALRYLAEFLRSRGRDDEARVYEERRAALSPSSTAPIV